MRIFLLTKGDEQAMEKERILNPHESLADKLRAIIYCEAAKNYQEMDDDLVAECVDYLMVLENRRPLTEDEIGEATKQIFAKAKKRRKKKISLIRILAAAILLILLVAALTVATFCADEAIEHFREWGEIIFNLDNGESVDIDNQTFIKQQFESAADYDSIDEFLKNEKPCILYPSAMPEGYEITYISRSDEGGGTVFTFTCQNPSYGLKVDNLTVPKNYVVMATASRETVNGYDCYYTHIKNDIADYIQCVFRHNGYTYQIGAETVEDVRFIINNLKETD